MVKNSSLPPVRFAATHSRMDQIQQFSKPLTKPNAKPKMQIQSTDERDGVDARRSTRPSIRQSTRTTIQTDKNTTA